MDGIFDALGILIALRVNMEHEKIMSSKRQLLILNSFFSQMNIILWPRFQTILESHFQSVKKVDLKSLSKIDFHPHFVIIVFDFRL